MKSKRLFLSLQVTLAFVPAGGCFNASKTAPIHDVVRFVSPLRELDGVTLGMSLEKLRRLRPNARVMGYRGWVEELHGDTIVFAFESMPNETAEEIIRDERAYAGDTPLRAVTLVQWQRALGIASSSVWSARRDELQRAVGEHPICFEYRGGLAPTRFAVWQLSSVVAAVVLTEATVAGRNSANPSTYPSQVRVVVANSPEQVDAALGLAERSTCE